MIVFLPFMQKNKTYASKKLQLCRKCSLRKPCQIISSTEAFILTLTMSKKHSDQSMLLFQKILSARWCLCFLGFISEERGSFFCPGQDVSFWLWHAHAKLVPQKLVRSCSRLSEELSCLFMRIT